MLGDPKKAITVMTIPIMVSYIFIQLNAFADALWCSGLGPDVSSAFLGMLPLLWIIRGIAIGISTGTSVSIARCLGRGDKEKASSIATQAIVLSIIISIIIIPIAFLFVEFVIQWVSLVKIAEQCQAYAFPIILSTPMIVLNAVIESILRTEGAAKKSMIVLISNALMCIVLDPVMIYVANLGLYGVSISTGISILISTVIGLYWYARKKMYVKISFKNFRFKRDEMISILTIGTTKSSESIITSLMALVHNALIVSVIGVTYIAMYSLPWKFVKLAAVFPHGAGTASMPVCSAALGAKDINKVKTGFVYSLKLSAICTIIFAIISFVFADHLSVAFTYSESMAIYKKDLVYGIRVYALLMPFMSVIKVASYIFYSIWKPKVSLCVSFLRDIIVALLLWLTIKSLHDVYWAFFFVEVVIAILALSIAYYFFQNYKNKLLATV